MGSETMIKTAVITGMHPFDVPNFHKLFRAMPDVDFYPQGMEAFVTSPREIREWYDVLVFFNMHRATPGEGSEPWDGACRTALESLGETPQGLLILHHAILAYPNWEKWNAVVGLDGSMFGYHIGETVQLEVADPQHPITSGLSGWSMVDETYTMPEPGHGSHVLLTTDHPKSLVNLAWTREHGQARVFCLQSGHDNDTWQDANFRTVVNRGIQWLARRI